MGETTTQHAGGIRMNAAAELLGVSPSTLRSWERRFGYPKPARTRGGHRSYDLAELETLRQALRETHSISAAVKLAAKRGRAPGADAQLVDALERFDEIGADRVMEESLSIRSVERSVEELLLPAVTALRDQSDREAEYEHACRWATAWLHRGRYLAPPASRDSGVLLLDASPPGADIDSLHVQGLELALRRAGFRVLVLPASLGTERVSRAVRALQPVLAFVLCGRGATLDAVGRLVHCARNAGSGAPVLEYRDAMPVSGGHAVRSAGSRPTEATDLILSLARGEIPAHPRRSEGGTGPHGRLPELERRERSAGIPRSQTA